MRSTEAIAPPPTAAGAATPAPSRRTAATLAVEHLSRAYGHVQALADVTWRAEPGETLCLLGHSGCGKTTLLRIIAGIEQPTSGRVLLDDVELSGPARSVAPEHRGIGLVFQDYALFPHLDVLANVRFGLRGLPAAEAEARATEALQRVGMARHLRSHPHTLSGGEQQRVALARALAPRPRVLLMDEPFSNLDRRTRDRVRDDTMTLLRETGTTAIVVTHEPEEALRIADRIVLMNGGRVEQLGSSEALYRRPRNLFVARFFDDLNELRGRVRDGHVDTPLGRFAAHGIEDGTAAVVVLHPQDLGVAAQGVAAHVLDRRFLGESDLLRIAVDGIDAPLLLRGSAPAAIGIGSTITVAVRPGAARVLEDAAHPASSNPAF